LTSADDGFPGGNFQRPGFLEMLEDAKNGVINLILVKDLSRLGRDYVEVGRYTDVVFPSLGCRFVSVLDCLDSESDNTDMLHFRSLMNDYHLRDLSSKVKSVLHSKKASGQFTAAYAPYGYCKGVEDRHKLVVDEYAANIVRRIFDMRLEGTGYAKIAAALNQEGIVSPRRYWYQLVGKDSSTISQLWTDSMVKIILHNETYIGNLCANRTGTRSYKDHTRIEKPESEWIRKEAVHEAIIPIDTWKAVQKINAAAKCRAGHTPPALKLFSGKLVCADCNSKLCACTETQPRKSGPAKKYVSYACWKFTRSGRCTCSSHRIYEQTLTQIVMAKIKAQAQAVILDEASEVNKLKCKVADYDEKRVCIVQREISTLRRRVRELEDMTAKLYEDKISGVISESTFTMLMQKNEQERTSKVERLDSLLSEISKVEQKTAAIQNWAALIRKYLDLRELDRATVDELIDYIVVGERTVVDGQRHQDIKIFYRFVGLVE